MTEKGLKLQFQIICNRTIKGQELFIVGNLQELGNWDTQHFQEYQKLNCIAFPLWQSVCIPFNNKTNIEYKFIIINPYNNNEIIQWENRNNRTLDISQFKDILYLIDDGEFDANSERKIESLEEIKIKTKNENNGANIKKNKEKIKNKNIINKKIFNGIENKNKEDFKENKKVINNFSIKKGLANIGATCYMNATLQCFFHIKPFVKFFKTNEQMINYNKTNTLSYSFKKLIDELLPDDKDSPQDNNNFVSPYEFKEKISKMDNLFAGIAANDSKDLVNFIILQLHEELNKAKKNNQIKNNKNLDQTNEELVRINFMKNFTDENQSIISNLFYAMNYTITECKMCQHKLYNYQTYFFLVFPLEEVRKLKYQNNFNQFNYINSNKVSIFDCFNFETKINWMTGANSMYCNFCKINTAFSMRTILAVGPNILILLLNRGKGLEFNVKILFEEILDLKHYIEYQNTGYMYKLIGVITHIGENGMGGHFIAYCRDPETEQWNKFNDAIVTPVNDFQKEVIDYENPYLLFYQKM